ncbi:hypothetical protein [Micromonospora sp. NPDC007230]|uniref:hypothetical protein n=1 Tax=Micromonospora sp. NPDC007230 TaxID=3364237 RepID=UPI0036CA0BAF
MTLLLVVAAMPELVVLLAGSGLVLFRRRRLGPVAWAALGALAMLIVALMANTVWTLYQLDLLVGDHDEGWRIVLRWNKPIRTLAGALSIIGMLLLVLSIFAARRPRGPDADPADRDSEPGSVDNVPGRVMR